MKIQSLIIAGYIILFTHTFAFSELKTTKHHDVITLHDDREDCGVLTVPINVLPKKEVGKIETTRRYITDLEGNLILNFEGKKVPFKKGMPPNFYIAIDFQNNTDYQATRKDFVLRLNNKFRKDVRVFYVNSQGTPECCEKVWFKSYPIPITNYGDCIIIESPSLPANTKGKIFIESSLIN